MAEDIAIVQGNKEERYRSLHAQVRALVEGEPNLLANMANTCAALKSQFDFLWVGFYLVEGSELVLGPFQGPVACTRIKMGKGVCGQAWERNEVIIVPDVDAFPGHIACSSLSRSEIVLPFSIDGKTIGVLDIDSSELASFDEVDARYLADFLKLLR